MSKNAIYVSRIQFSHHYQVQQSVKLHTFKWAKTSTPKVHTHVLEGRIRPRQDRGQALRERCSKKTNQQEDLRYILKLHPWLYLTLRPSSAFPLALAYDSHELVPTIPNTCKLHSFCTPLAWQISASYRSLWLSFALWPACSPCITLAIYSMWTLALLHLLYFYEGGNSLRGFGHKKLY